MDAEARMRRLSLIYAYMEWLERYELPLSAGFVEEMRMDDGEARWLAETVVSLIWKGLAHAGGEGD